MFVETLCRFCGQRARFEDPDGLIDNYPHRFNGSGELEPMACDLQVDVQVVDKGRTPESPFVPTPTRTVRVVCRENVKDAFPHHKE